MKLDPFEPYRWVMPILLHASCIHVLMNLLSQLILGSFIEPILGMTRAALIYFVSGYALGPTCRLGGVLFGCLYSDSLSVGASGALYGWCGALVSQCFINASVVGMDIS